MVRRSRTSIDGLLKQAEKLAHYGVDSDRSTYALRGVDKPLGKRHMKKQSMRSNVIAPGAELPKPRFSKPSEREADLPESWFSHDEALPVIEGRGKAGTVRVQKGSGDKEILRRVRQVAVRAEGEDAQRLFARAVALTARIKDPAILEQARGYVTMLARKAETVSTRLEKTRVYLYPHEKAPEWADVKTSPRGARYYESRGKRGTGRTSPQTPEETAQDATEPEPEAKPEAKRTILGTGEGGKAIAAAAEQMVEVAAELGFDTSDVTAIHVFTKDEWREHWQQRYGGQEGTVVGGKLMSTGLPHAYHDFDGQIGLNEQLGGDLAHAVNNKGHLPYGVLRAASVKTLAHELLHGYNPAGQDDYFGAGALIEEALTEWFAPELAIAFATNVLKWPRGETVDALRYAGSYANEVDTINWMASLVLGHTELGDDDYSPVRVARHKIRDKILEWKRLPTKTRAATIQKEVWVALLHKELPDVPEKMLVRAATKPSVAYTAFMRIWQEGEGWKSTALTAAGVKQLKKWIADHTKTEEKALIAKAESEDDIVARIYYAAIMSTQEQAARLLPLASKLAAKVKSEEAIYQVSSYLTMLMRKAEGAQKQRKLKKGRVYLYPHEKAPEWADVKTSPRGARYYEGKTRGKKAEDEDEGGGNEEPNKLPDVPEGAPWVIHGLTGAAPEAVQAVNSLMKKVQRDMEDYFASEGLPKPAVERVTFNASMSSMKGPVGGFGYIAYYRTNERSIALDGNITDKFKRIAEGEKLTRWGYIASGLQTLAHEVNHAVNPISSYGYSGVEACIEEGLTELHAPILAKFIAERRDMLPDPVLEEDRMPRFEPESYYDQVHVAKSIAGTIATRNARIGRAETEPATILKRWKYKERADERSGNLVREYLESMMPPLNHDKRDESNRYYMMRDDARSGDTPAGKDFKQLWERIWLGKAHGILEERLETAALRLLKKHGFAPEAEALRPLKKDFAGPPADAMTGGDVGPIAPCGRCRRKVAKHETEINPEHSHDPTQDGGGKSAYLSVWTRKGEIESLLRAARLGGGRLVAHERGWELETGRADKVKAALEPAGFKVEKFKRIRPGSTAPAHMRSYGKRITVAGVIITDPNDKVEKEWVDEVHAVRHATASVMKGADASTLDYHLDRLAAMAAERKERES